MFVILLHFATVWQNGVREAVGWGTLDSSDGWRLSFVAVVTAFVCVAIGRGIAYVYRGVRRRTDSCFARRGWHGRGALAALTALGGVALGTLFAWLALSSGVVL